MKILSLLYFIGIGVSVNAQNDSFYVELEKRKTRELIYFPDEPYNAYKDRAWARLNLEKYSEAIMDCDSALTYSPLDYLILVYKGVGYINLNQNNEAIVVLNKAIKLKKDFSPAYYNRALANYNIKNMRGAIADYSKAIYFDPNDSDSYYNRGLIFLHQNKFKDAISDFSSVIKLCPQKINGYINRARANYGMGEFDKVIQDAEIAINIDSVSAHPYKYLGLALIKKENKMQGCDYLKKAEALGAKLSDEEKKICF
jgi:tetratricopeptide (TPR) repeat protein